jgi:hypothetical protein
MKHTLLGLALLFSSLVLGAQDRTGPAAQKIPQQAKIISLACPVEMLAKQRGSSQLVEVRNGKRTETPGQRILLTLRTGQSPHITSARVTVRGLTSRGRLMGSDSSENLSSDASRTMTVVFNETTNGGVTGELTLPGFTSVTSISLEEIIYDNGTLWRVGDNGVCRVAPDPFMLISDR